MKLGSEWLPIPSSLDQDAVQLHGLKLAFSLEHHQRRLLAAASMALWLVCIGYIGACLWLMREVDLSHLTSTEYCRVFCWPWQVLGLCMLGIGALSLSRSSTKSLKREVQLLKSAGVNPTTVDILKLCKYTTPEVRDFATDNLERVLDADLGEFLENSGLARSLGDLLTRVTKQSLVLKILTALPKTSPEYGVIIIRRLIKRKLVRRDPEIASFAAKQLLLCEMIANKTGEAETLLKPIRTLCCDQNGMLLPSEDPLVQHETHPGP